MIGFYVVNLLPPATPLQFNLQTPCGTWEFQQVPNFRQVHPAVLQGATANTYTMSFRLPVNGPPSLKDAAFEELVPICLAASFVTGASVTIKHSLEASSIQFITVGPHFPRDRGLANPAACVNTFAEFIAFVERFVAQYRTLDAVEKLRLLMHFFIDATACWSLENLYLSGSTLLQVVADTEKSTGRPFASAHAAQRNQGRPTNPGFFDLLAGAANRISIAPLTHDVVKVRNSLVHAGTLQSASLPTQADAAVPIAEAMHWFDQYVYAILGLGSVPVNRYPVHLFTHGINSFSF
ncbi:hypothetical protein [Hydrogenophaga sp. NFH-34]|uniref:hypothetical protein n=1 Tax=Hydrogenophaga sp. NFH-34 TaxID=2744446 RepID=UPI001F47B8F5|nr:hypothetical protein [Hydrogenophaga sp. NFH-34]